MGFRDAAIFGAGVATGGAVTYGGQKLYSHYKGKKGKNKNKNKNKGGGLRANTNSAQEAERQFEARSKKE